jgi:hypothetical protein
MTGVDKMHVFGEPVASSVQDYEVGTIDLEGDYRPRYFTSYGYGAIYSIGVLPDEQANNYLIEDDTERMAS